MKGRTLKHKFAIIVAQLLLAPLAASHAADTGPLSTERAGGSYEAVVKQDRERILKAAAEALNLEPFSITQCRSPLSEGGPNDFFSMSDYYWPDPAKPDGKPYVQRDGEYPGRPRHAQGNGLPLSVPGGQIQMAAEARRSSLG